MDKVLPQEILIKIFKYLTPIDLCFSVSLVNTLFYQLSLVNDIWSQFKCDGWSETMNVKQSKYSLPFRSSPKLDSNFFLKLFTSIGLKNKELMLKHLIQYLLGILKTQRKKMIMETVKSKFMLQETSYYQIIYP